MQKQNGEYGDESRGCACCFCRPLSSCIDSHGELTEVKGLSSLSILSYFAIDRIIRDLSDRKNCQRIDICCSSLVNASRQTTNGALVHSSLYSVSRRPSRKRVALAISGQSSNSNSNWPPNLLLRCVRPGRSLWPVVLRLYWPFGAAAVIEG